MTLRVDQIIPTSGNTITIPSGNRLVGTDPGTFDGPPRVGSIVQVVNQSTYPTSHLSIASTGEASAPLIGTITPKYASSKIKVEFWSTMMYGAANALVTVLYRQIAGGGYTNLTPIANTTSRYYYGWMYNTSGWHSHVNTYIDSPATTSLVEYRCNYRNWSSTATNYLVHSYMEYGWTLYEIYQ
jgi:hypothetical protein